MSKYILKTKFSKKRDKQPLVKEYKGGEIHVFKNKDKEGWYESWYNGRDLMNFPHPFRCIVSANPGCGKTNMIKNLLVKARPYFDVIFLCHYDPDTKEYDDIDLIQLDKLPDSRASFFQPVRKSCLIIDDYDFGALSKDQHNNLRSLFKYASTHRGVSIIVACQDFFNIPVIIRRLSNIYFIWKGSCDLDSLYMVGRKVGYTKDEFRDLLNLCKNKFDQICIDFTNDTPASVRLNGYTLIKGGTNALGYNQHPIDEIEKDLKKPDEENKQGTINYLKQRNKVIEQKKNKNRLKGIRFK